MNRRKFLVGVLGLGGVAILTNRQLVSVRAETSNVKKITRTDAEWRKLLTPEQYHILREEGTEPPGSSPLDKQYGKGTYVCAGCELALFTSETKYDSRTGWPSFYRPIEGAVETELDFKLLIPRTEYHCVRCGGHQGHIFKDGPPPTGQRWCNNGLALKFIPAA